MAVLVAKMVHFSFNLELGSLLMVEISYRYMSPIVSVLSIGDSSCDMSPIKFYLSDQFQKSCRDI